MTVKLIETDSEFLEVAGHKVEAEGKEFYYLPFWYEKISGGLYKQHKFENLPSEVIKMIIEQRQP